jgi:hypothetical protein
MVNLQGIIQSVLKEPTPAVLVTLQGALLGYGQQGQAVERALEIAGRFHSYLCELQSKITARDYSELASRLDIGAVGAVALENVISGEGGDVWKRLLLGGLGEALMVSASRQYIKAWETETGLIHVCAAWYLTEALWRTSCEMQPDLPPDLRWKAILALLSPAYDPDVAAPDKAALLGRIFQILLLTRLAPLLPAASAES